MSKFICVEVTREEFSAVFIKVPDDFVPSDAYSPQFRPKLERAIKHLDTFDWELDPDSVTPGTVREAPESEALNYPVFDAEKP